MKKLMNSRGRKKKEKVQKEKKRERKQMKIIAEKGKADQG